jgi:hypothetical protein
MGTIGPIIGPIKFLLMEVFSDRTWSAILEIGSLHGIDKCVSDIYGVSGYSLQ